MSVTHDLRNNEINDKNHQGVLDVEWNLKSDSFQFKVHLNFSLSKKKQRTGSDIQLSNLTRQEQIPLIKKMLLSRVNGFVNCLKCWSEQIP